MALNPRHDPSKLSTNRNSWVQCGLHWHRMNMEALSSFRESQEHARTWVGKGGSFQFPGVSRIIP